MGKETKIKLDESQLKLIKHIKKIVRKGSYNMIATVKSVSSSGMSRTMSFHIPRENGAGYYCINYIMAEVCGYTRDKNGNIKRNGCGMDMVFDTLEGFYNAIKAFKDNSANNSAACYYTMV